MGIVCESVGYSYPLPNRKLLTTLDGVSFAVRSGEFMALLGPSGCGKSTLLKLIANLIQPTSGSIRVTDSAQNKHGPAVAMVFQQHGVLPWLSVLDNVIFGLERFSLSKNEKRERARDAINRVHLSGFEAAFPHQLSGGMQQRVNIARALVCGAPTLLMDEPFAALDAQTRLIMQEELLTLWESERKTVIYVTHDIDEALLLADRVLVMSQRPGTIRAEVAAPLSRPRSLHDIEHPTFREMRWQIWNLLDLKSPSAAVRPPG
ncbi:MAG: ABC transporter ATP-binding protein [Chloroflexi bacterium]|nr:ABC transporter ATP-binding protein [Chloroflexota bacterium]